MILGLETSGRSGSVALCFSLNNLFTAFTAKSEGSAKSLAPVVSELLRHTQVEPSNLKAIGVTIGPGSFTGLRVGVAFSKAMAYGLGIPVIGIDTLEALAFDFQTWMGLAVSSSHQNSKSLSRETLSIQSNIEIINLAASGVKIPFWTILDAYRGEFFVAKWECSFARNSCSDSESFSESIPGKPKFQDAVEDSISCLIPSQIVSKQRWQELATQDHSITSSIIAVGSGVEKLLLGEPALAQPVVRYSQIIPTASSVATLAWRQWKLGKGISPMELMPVYLRGSAAEEKLHSKDRIPKT